MVQNNQELRRKYWATCLSVCSFARTAHSFACSRLLSSLATSAALTHSLARSLRSLHYFTLSKNNLVLSHSASAAALDQVVGDARGIDVFGDAERKGVTSGLSSTFAQQKSANFSAFQPKTSRITTHSTLIPPLLRRRGRRRKKRRGR